MKQLFLALILSASLQAKDLPQCSPPTLHSPMISCKLGSELCPITPEIKKDLENLIDFCIQQTKGKAPCPSEIILDEGAMFVQCQPAA